MSVTGVDLWGTRIGAASWDAQRRHARFEYDAAFLASGVQVAPLMIPLQRGVHVFPELAHGSFLGLPGLLADSLPDRFGSALLDAWLASQGRTSADFDPVQRLMYVGRRGMGALEFAPEVGDHPTDSQVLEVEALVGLANRVLSDRAGFVTDLEHATPAMRSILRVGTSAGGARAKAVIAWNPETGEVRSGQADVGAGFGHWLIKFDGVTENKDRELADPLGFGLIEFAYQRLARAAGIEMNECRLLREGGRAHFVTRRFDRTTSGEKLHMQSLAALAHLDFNFAGAHSYEQALQVIRRLGLSMDAVEEQFRRMCFNLLARNQDDHVKNIAFLMDKSGTWRLSPAFDVTFAYNPAGAWTSRHQMTLNGKADGFERADFEACARLSSMGRGRARDILAEVAEAVADWPAVAAEAGVEERLAREIRAAHRTIE